MLIEMSLKEYVLEATSGNPTPGGGSVSALVGSLGGALTNMVGNLTIGKKIYESLSEEIKKEMEKSFEEINKKIHNLTLIVDEDASAFDSVLEAFRMSKETDEEKSKRAVAIQEGYKKALEVPLRCAEECSDILKLQNVFAIHGNKNAITDVGVGALLAYSGLEGALFNVTINLLSIKDLEYKKDIELKVDTLLSEGKKLKEELLKIVYSRLV